MIIVKLMGGLGNQMFQYAIGRKLALKYNSILKLDCSFLEEKPNNPWYTLRNYELDVFSFEAEFATSDDIKKVYNQKPLFLDYLTSKIIGKPIPYYRHSIIKEQGFEYDKNIFRSHKNIMLDGYWQSEKYFKDIAQIICQDFIIKDIPDEYNKNILQIIQSTNSISIHFRRGDYVNHETTNKFHGICSIRYYKTAVEYIKQYVESPVFFVFSDDIDWVKSNFEIDYPIYFIDKNQTKSYEDLRLMSACKHNIIANSSFSWWAAWLNNYIKKIVISPQNWFNESSLNIRDLIPEMWIKCNMEQLTFIPPAISVNMPVYNGAKFLRQAIDSILNQTFADFELIIVDDGSIDESIAIIESYTDIRIHLHKNSYNRGLAYTRNKAKENSLGKYIAILDCDDIAISNRLEKQYLFLEKKTDYVLVGAWIDFIDENGMLTGEGMQYTVESQVLKSQLFFGNYFAQSAIMIKRSIFNEFEYEEKYAPAEDYFLWSQISFKYNIANLQETLVHYRIHQNSISNQKILVQEHSVKSTFVFHLSHLKLINLNENQFILHYNILRNKYNCNSITLYEKNEILRWLRLLKKRNGIYNIYDKKFFEHNLQIYWNVYFDYLSTFQLGIKAIPFIFDSFNKELNLKVKILFIIRCFKFEILSKLCKH